MKKTNIFAVFNVCTKEDVHTNVFKYCIENSPQFRKAFVRSVLDWPSNTPLIGVETRMSLPEIGFPDMVVVGGLKPNPKIGIVEVKLHATEGIDQTDRYASGECLSRVLTNLELRSSSKPDLVFLTLYPDDVPQNKEFRPVTLRGLLSALNRTKISGDYLSSQLLADWRECLGEFYRAGDLRDGDLLGSKLASGSLLDSGYLSFVQLFRSLRPVGLQRTGPGRSSPQGRPFYGIRFHKASWYLESLPSDQWHRFNPSRHFDIHIEVQFDRLRAKLDCFVHYETRPYIPKLQDLISARKYSAHMIRRTVFKTAISDLLPHGFTIASDKSVNQIARVHIPLAGLTVNASRKKITRLLSTISKAIDQALLTLS